LTPKHQKNLFLIRSSLHLIFILLYILKLILLGDFNIFFAKKFSFWFKNKSKFKHLYRILILRGVPKHLRTIPLLRPYKKNPRYAPDEHYNNRLFKKFEEKIKFIYTRCKIRHKLLRPYHVQPSQRR